jgi:transcriptional antiterminator RfaH
MPFWAVVTTQPAAESRALAHLEWQGFTAYGPREKIVRVRQGRKVSEARWLFPRYLFVWIIDRWYDLLSTIGISKLLMNGDVPAQLPPGFVEALKARERGGLITLPKPHRFKIGQRVQVAGGIFDGARGLYRGMTSKLREIVVLDALGARVELAPNSLRSAA